MKLYDINETASYLHISTATVKNWMRSGRLVPYESKGDKALFLVKDIHEIAGKLESEGKLKSRRNKTARTGASSYKGYLSVPIISDACLDEISSIIKKLPANGLRLVLAEYARRFFLQLGKEDKIAKRLLTDLRNTDKFFPSLSSLPILPFVKGEDILGYLYISLSVLNKRKKNGIYYTPASTADKLLSNIKEMASVNNCIFIDPACGTGNFFLRMRSFVNNPTTFRGQDMDEVAILLCRINIALNYDLSNTDPSFLWEHFTISDSLQNFPGAPYAPAIYLGNPPWGALLHWENYDFPAMLRKKDTSALFLWKTLEQAKEGDKISYLLPSALLSVHTYGEVRKTLLEKMNLTSVTYLGNSFSNVDCPAVILSGNKKKKSFDDNISGSQKVAVETPLIHNCRIETPSHRFTIANRTPFHPDFYMLHATDSAYETIRNMRALENCTYLKGQADFALGIVTGDNKRFLIAPAGNNDDGIVTGDNRRFLIAPAGNNDDGIITGDNRRFLIAPAGNNDDSIAASYEPVLKGENIVPYGIHGPYHSMEFKPELFQQCAREELYRAKEKLLYRFIGTSPTFAYDDKGRISLNSCNVLIPRIPGLSIKYVLAILNSSAAKFYFTTCFASVKLLRSHIESLPIPIADKAVQNKIEIIVNNLITFHENDAIIRTSKIENSPDILSKYRKYYEELDEIICKLYHQNQSDFFLA